MLIVKKHFDNGRLILAVCDPELVGLVFEDKNIVLDLSKSFYRGDLTPNDVVESLMKEAYIMNLVGEHSVKLALDNNLISKELVFRIKNVPYAYYVNDALK